jgi:DNA-binding GntR family transcriptional regulator
LSQTIRYKSTADYATAEIQRLILSGGLPSGARIDQIELAKQLDVSRHPVRQAIERLSERGFINLNPHKSAIVADLTVEDMDELYLTRSLMESWAVAAAWPNFVKEDRVTIRALETKLKGLNPESELDSYMEANRAFHLAFYSPCGNRHMLRSIATLFDLSERYQRTALQYRTRIEQSNIEHAAMVRALGEPGPEKLIEVITAHNAGTQATLRHRLTRKANRS